MAERDVWSLKGSFPPDFRNAVRMAAERQGMTQAAWVRETLWQAARDVLAPSAEQPAATLPMRLEDMADVLTARMAELVRAEVRAATPAPAPIDPTQARRVRMAQRAIYKRR